MKTSKTKLIKWIKNLPEDIKRNIHRECALAAVLAQAAKVDEPDGPQVVGKMAVVLAAKPELDEGQMPADPLALQEPSNPIDDAHAPPARLEH